MQQKLKQAQIPEDLLIDLIKWHLCPSDMIRTQDRAERIHKGLQNKLDSMAARDLYSVMHDTTKSPQERESARQAYLDSKGIPEAFRW